jgi:hypothetical protein
MKRALAHFEKVEDGVYGIVATAGDVQVGWCRQQGDNRMLFDMDENNIAGNFEDFRTVNAEGLRLLAHFSASRNPGH